MKLFLFAIGDRDRASSRLRVWDHVTWLEDQGYAVTADSLTGPGRVGKLALIRRLLRRIPAWARQFWISDVVLIQESLLLWPLLLVRNVGRTRRIIFDFSDPVDRIGSPMHRHLRNKLFALTVRTADAVIVENRAYLSRFPDHSSKFRHFYGPVNAARYAAHAPTGAPTLPRDRVRIGWTGSPSTLAFIAMLFPIIDELARDYPIELVLMGVSTTDYRFRHAKVTFLDWEEAAEFATVPSFDIGLFRLEPTEDALWRGAGKLFIYCAAGVPFVASCRGIARDLMLSTQLGFPVLDDSDWAAVLTRAVSDHGERARQRELLKAFAREQLSYESYRKCLKAWIDGRREGVD